MAFEQPEEFKNFKTISYELQDDGKFWNYDKYATEENATLTSVTQGIEVAGLETVQENADLEFIVAFKGEKPTFAPGLVAVEGDYLFLLKTKDNKIIKFEADRVNNNVQASDYSFKTESESMTSYAGIVTDYANRYINDLSYLISGKSLEKLPFGVFKKNKRRGSGRFYYGIKTSDRSN